MLESPTWLTKEKVTIPETQEELIALAERLISDRTKFAPGEIPQKFSHPKYTSHKNYAFFPPLYYFGNGFIDVPTMNALRNGANTLVIGTGDAMLEKLFIEGFGINPQSLTSQDYQLTTQAEHGLANNKHTYNIFDKWPDFKNKFKIILFPEVLDKAAKENIGSKAGKIKPDTGLFRELKDLVPAYQTTDQISMDDHLLKFMAEVEKGELAWPVKTGAIKKALACLEEGGQIRISDSGNGYVNVDAQCAYLKIKLANSGHKLKIYTGDVKGGDIIIIEKLPRTQST